MRESDRILAADLRAAGLNDLAERAEKGEWNDYFGDHDLPQIHLVQTLRDEVKGAGAVRRRLIANVINGKYDGTKEESDEWARSPEGQEAWNDLTGGGGR